MFALWRFWRGRPDRVDAGARSRVTEVTILVCTGRVIKKNGTDDSIGLTYTRSGRMLDHSAETDYAHRANIARVYSGRIFPSVGGLHGLSRAQSSDGV